MTGVVVDSSAVVAISLREPGHEWLTGQVGEHSDPVAPNALEVTMVLEGRLAESEGLGRRILTQLGIHVISFTPEMPIGQRTPGADSAREAIPPR